jgi:hypothetical protein
MMRPIDGEPTTIEECSALREWAEGLPSTDEVPADREQIERHLGFMAATLPSKAVDDESGRKRFAVYVSLLSGFSEEALAYMARQACATLRWFPVPVECLDLVREYRPAPSRRDLTLRLCHDFMHNSFERWIANVSDGQPIGEVPDQWKRIAAEQHVLRRLADGSYVSRALFVGPVRPYLPAKVWGEA